MRKRREAAGLSVDQVALTIGGVHGDPQATAAAAAAARNAIQMLEANDPAPDAHLAIVERLCGAFAFDRGVHLALVALAADPELPSPPVCRICACSWSDACRGPNGNCSWADEALLPGQLPICSACKAKEPAHAA